MAESMKRAKKSRQRASRYTIQQLRVYLARERDARTHYLRTISELRWAIHDLFAHFEQHRGGYTHAELARVEEIRTMGPPFMVQKFKTVDGEIVFDPIEIVGPTVLPPAPKPAVGEGGPQKSL